ncbi:cation:proton antiporter [Zeaxanthinibacter enoshimensis]|uniref:NhaP-type Na+/H+ or K+/H+ antiporter n=1 Tax=Zeaxanthinibacter enoshimensis TaxID=392009 RepID=A0A4R6TLF3_9FLAO|nr:cation:proton antiporter [Zeaxanthinibacter enoshimensis]TDQ32184.1 NhaP-type Na+/H+ or K+/H+ antiporter [Zeaxanthinibacter enoshimensis]
MDTHLWIYIVIGFFGLCLPWLKSLEKIQLLNVPIIAIGLGMVLFSLPISLPDPNPVKFENEILKLSEIAVIISLMGAGLKINRDFSLKAYRVPLLLVLITMTGCIVTTAALGWWFGLVPASALLLGAVFAPTDPVLASDVQVKIEEDEDEEHPVQFNLTAEAGINDGMAFPFTWLAIWVAMYGFNMTEWVGTWLLKDLLYRIAGGVLVGYGSGRLLAWLFLTLPKKINFKPQRIGFLAVAATFFIYGISEAVHVYGFIAVFVAALTFRHYEKQHSMQKEMHDVVEQVEQFLITIILLLLGGYIATNWFDVLTFPIIGLCLLFIFVIRPLFGIMATFKTIMPWKHRWSVAFLGIKGVGSFFYLAFALHETDFEQEELLWSTVAFLVLISAVIHRIAGYYVKKKVL